MTVLENTPAKTVLIHRPPRAVVFGAAIVLAGLASWALTFPAVTPKILALVGFTLALFLTIAARKNHRILTFLWNEQTVESRMHWWNPLFRDEIESHSIEDLACWYLKQDVGGRDTNRTRASRFWDVGFQRASGRRLDLFSERDFKKARSVVRLLAAQQAAPVLLDTAFDHLQSEDLEAASGLLFQERVEASEGIPDSIQNPAVRHFTPGHLELVLPTAGPRFVAKGGHRVSRAVFFLFEAVLILAIAIALPFIPQFTQQPHRMIVLLVLWALGLPLLGLGFRELFGRIHLIIRDGTTTVRRTLLGIPLRVRRAPNQEWRLAVVYLHGADPCLYLFFAGREYRAGRPLDAPTLLAARRRIHETLNLATRSSD